MIDEEQIGKSYKCCFLCKELIPPRTDIYTISKKEFIYDSQGYSGFTARELYCGKMTWKSSINFCKACYIKAMGTEFELQSDERREWY